MTHRCVAHNHHVMARFWWFITMCACDGVDIEPQGNQADREDQFVRGMVPLPLWNSHSVWWDRDQLKTNTKQ